ncbi:D-beta-hydroxybutyrate dehydrogenase, mitochondrial-like [Mytilus trossulus]
MNITTAYRILCIVFFIWFVFNICVNYYVYIFLLIILKLTFIYLEQNYKKLLPVQKRCVLITGCDTGFGHHLANRLADDGFNVFATVWKVDSPGANKLKKRKSNMHVIQMDVTKIDEIKAAVSFVNTKTKQKGLWGVVNNAGFNIYGDVEICTMDHYRAVLDVNLYGMISVTKAFLPQIRNNKGRIVNVSSVMARLNYPGNTNYQISKHGVETMSDSLRLEMIKFGVGVSIIEPGEYDAATSCSSPEMCKRVKADCEQMYDRASEEVKAVYGKDYFYLPYENMRQYGETGSSPTPNPVLNAIEDALLNVHPKARYLVDGGSGIIDKTAIMARIDSLLPEYVSDFIWSTRTGCYKSPRDQSA